MYDRPMSELLDVLVVGARCAGATLALFLARAGKRVLVIDQAHMPSDQPISTHFIGPHGMAILDELGVGAKVRVFAPAVPHIINGVEDAIARLPFEPGREGTCPRRADLDALLVDEARAAGAEVALRTKLVGVLRESGRVVGAIVEHEGKRREIHAALVVGADGQHSKVAALVEAEEYKGYDCPRAAYWAYWPRPASYATDERYGGGAALVYFGDEYRIIFPTNTDQLLIGIGFPNDKLGEWKGRHREVYLERLRAHPWTASFTAGEPSSKIVGFVKGRFFFRQATGPGWALVGDAGLFKDPAPGLGISDAFRDAKALAAAIAEGGDAALERYWRERDVNSIELFEFARELGSVGYNNPLNHKVFAKVAASAELRGRIIEVHERRRSPFALFSTFEVVSWVLGELVRGRFGILRPFLEAGKRGGEVAKELAERRALAQRSHVVH